MHSSNRRFPSVFQQMLSKMATYLTLITSSIFACFFPLFFHLSFSICQLFPLFSLFRIPTGYSIYLSLFSPVFILRRALEELGRRNSDICELAKKSFFPFHIFVSRIRSGAKLGRIFSSLGIFSCAGTHEG